MSQYQHSELTQNIKLNISTNIHIIYMSYPILIYSLPMDDGFGNILDTVLGDIDNLLLSNVPMPNKAVSTTPNLPPLPCNDDECDDNLNNINMNMNMNMNGTINRNVNINRTMNVNINNKRQSIKSISCQMDKIQINMNKQIQVIEKQQISTNGSNNNNNNNNGIMKDLDLNIFTNGYNTTTIPINYNTMNRSSPYLHGMTPNTSYNSLASLDTNHSINTGTSSCTSTTYIQQSPYINGIRSPQFNGQRLMNNNNHNNHNNDDYKQQQQQQQQHQSGIYQYGGEQTQNISNVFNGCSTKIIQFEPINDIKLQLKDYVFISKDCTRRLGQYVVKENWGKEYGLLYKYLDYIFRCQAFKRQIIEINDKYLIFHSGLQRRCDNQFLYVLLVPNKKYVAQKWRVQFGNIKNSFLSKAELLSKFTESYVVDDYLPQRTRFCGSLSDLLYDETFPIEVHSMLPSAEILCFLRFCAWKTNNK